MYYKVYIEITNICNMNCSFCHRHKRANRQMTLEEFSHILEALTGKTQYLYYHLMGEPLTHPLLPAFLEMAKAKGFKSIITTNGTLLKKRGQDILTAGVHKVNLSLHSFENGTEKDQAAYIQDLATFAKQAREVGTIVVFRLWNQGCDDGKNDVSLRELKKHFPNEWEEHPRGIKLADKVYLEWGERFEWPDQEASVKGDRFFCYGLKDHFGILVDGTVVPCCLDSEGTIALGNIFTTPAEEILASRRATALVDGFRCGKASEPLCQRCGYAQRFV